MCDECGCGNPSIKPENDNRINKTIAINKSITEVNDVIAEQISEFLKEKKVLCVNLMGAPGSGKTTFIEGLSHHIDPKDIAVIQGDLEADIDKIRLEKNNISTYQINTHSGCHLNSTMINKILLNIDITNKKYLIIENVGNLVCPAGVNIGQHVNIVISATTEGSDKPKKYPIIFLDADAVVISKYDFSSITKFNEELYIQDIKRINGKITIFKTNMNDKSSFKQVVSFLSHKRDHLIGHKHHH